MKYKMLCGPVNQLGRLAALTEDLSLVPSIPAHRWITSACDSSSGDLTPSISLCGYLNTYASARARTHREGGRETDRHRERDLQTYH